MPDLVTAARSETYLVEHYGPGINADGLERSAARVRDAITEMRREGHDVAYISSTIVPSDDYMHSVVRAPSEALVRAVLARAQLSYERISGAISVGDAAHPDEGRHKQRPHPPCSMTALGPSSTPE